MIGYTQLLTKTQTKPKDPERAPAGSKPLCLKSALALLLIKGLESAGARSGSVWLV